MTGGGGLVTAAPGLFVMTGGTGSTSGNTALIATFFWFIYIFHNFYITRTYKFIN